LSRPRRAAGHVRLRGCAAERRQRSARGCRHARHAAGARRPAGSVERCAQGGSPGPPGAAAPSGDAMRGAQRATRRETGQAVAEFAIVLPVLALLLLAIINYGLAFSEYNTLGFAASRAAQRAALTTDPTPTAGDYPAISQTIQRPLSAPIDPRP